MANEFPAPHEIVQIAALAQVDPKTVRRCLVLGLPVRALTRERILKAMEELAKAKGKRR